MSTIRVLTQKRTRAWELVVDSGEGPKVVYLYHFMYRLYARMLKKAAL